MQQMTPELAGGILRHVSVPVLTREQPCTASVIAAVPPDQGDYRPDAVSKSAMELAWHIASAELWFLDGVIAGAFNSTPHPRPDSIRTSADVSAWYAENSRAKMEQIQGLSDEQACKIIDFRGVMQVPAVMMLDIAIRHTIHHRGQLSAYLRPMGAKIPAIYGESYDSAQLRVSGQTA